MRPRTRGSFAPSTLEWAASHAAPPVDRADMVARLQAQQTHGELERHGQIPATRHTGMVQLASPRIAQARPGYVRAGTKRRAFRAAPSLNPPPTATSDTCVWGAARVGGRRDMTLAPTKFADKGRARVPPE
jgi:hypothetical protein